VVGFLLSHHPASSFFSRSLDLGYLAESINSGHGLSSPFGGSTGPTAFVTPGYAAIVALIFHFFGSYSSASAVALLLLQVTFAVLTVHVVVHVANRLFGPRTANVAGAIWAVSLPLLSLPVIPWDTCLSAFLLMSIVALALRCVEHPRTLNWVILGIACGLAMWVNPSLLLTFAVILGWAMLRTSSSWTYEPLLCVLLILAIFAPWPIRNARVMRAFIPVRDNFGYEMWQGNHPGATGAFDPDLQPVGNKAEYADYASQGELAFMHRKSAEAKDYIRANPGQFVRLTGLRIVRFWTGTGDQEISPMQLLHMSVTSVLGFLGLALLFRSRNPLAGLFLMIFLIFPLPYYITHPDVRFRALLDPLLTILTAYLLISLWQNRSFSSAAEMSLHAVDVSR